MVQCSRSSAAGTGADDDNYGISRVMASRTSDVASETASTCVSFMGVPLKFETKPAGSLGRRTISGRPERSSFQEVVCPIYERDATSGMLSGIAAAAAKPNSGPKPNSCLAGFPPTVASQVGA